MMQTRRTIFGVVATLGALALLGWWLSGGDAPTERLARGDDASANELGGGAPVALAAGGLATSDLAASERAVESRASLDDRRPWTATLAFAPDMAWLAPQLVWRVRATGGDGDEVVEPLASLPLDEDGDGAIVLALQAPPEWAGERVVIDLHVADETEYWLATLQLPANGARVDVRWTDLPLVAAGVVVPEASAHELAVECRVYLRLTEEESGSSGRSVPLVVSSRCLRGDDAQFCVLDNWTRDPSLCDRAVVELELVRGANSVSIEREVPLATSGVVLGVDRASARIALTLPPNTCYPHLGVSVVDVHDRVITFVELDRLAKSAVHGVAELTFTAPPGRVRCAIVDHYDGIPVLDEALHTVHSIEIFAGETTSYPFDGPLDVAADPRLAQVTVLPDAPPRITAWWECDAAREHAFDIGGWEPGTDTRDKAPTSVVMFVPPSARVLCVSAVGATTQRLDAWRGFTRVLEFEVTPPARITVDWSRSELAAVAGELQLMFTLPSVVGPQEQAFITNLRDRAANLTLRLRCGSNESMLVDLAAELPSHAVSASVRTSAHLSEMESATFTLDENGRIVTNGQRRVCVLDITSNGESCLGVRPPSDYLSPCSVVAHLEPGREYAVHLGDSISRADDE